jgi:hypothetical protein
MMLFRFCGVRPAFYKAAAAGVDLANARASGNHSAIT